jgi:hypothetical protein
MLDIERSRVEYLNSRKTQLIYSRRSSIFFDMVLNGAKILKRRSAKNGLSR